MPLLAEDQESKQVHLSGVVIRDLSSVVSNYRSKSNLSDYLKKQNVRGIANVDTRAITRRLRESGNLNGIITSDSSLSDEELIERARSWSIVGKDLITDISIKEPYEWKDATVDEWEFSKAVRAQNGATEPLHVSMLLHCCQLCMLWCVVHDSVCCLSALHILMSAVPFPPPGAGPLLTVHQSAGSDLAVPVCCVQHTFADCSDASRLTRLNSSTGVCSDDVMQAVLSVVQLEASLAGVQIVAYDFGCKHNILRRLASFGCKVTVVPSNYPAAKVMDLQPDGIFLSNGPVCIYTASKPA